MFLDKFKKNRTQAADEKAKANLKKRLTVFNKDLILKKLSVAYREITSNKTNLALATSFTALAIAAIASITAIRSSNSNAFMESDENVSRTVLNDDGRKTTVVDSEFLSEMEDRITRNVIDGVTGTNSESDLGVIKINSNPVVSDNPNSVVSADEIRFKDKKEFSAAVAEAIAEIRNQEIRQEIVNKQEKYANAQETVPGGRHLYGNPKARFIIKEFSDVECPFCKSFFDTPKEVADQSNGQVAVEWVHTPLSFHDPVATNEAIATECIFEQKGNKAFWVSLQHLFDTTFGNGKGSTALASIPKAFELDEERYLTCLNSDKTRKIVEDSKNYAASKGVNGTPGSLIIDTKTGKEQFIGGAQDQYVLMEAIEKLNAEEALASTQKSTEQKS